MTKEEFDFFLNWLSPDREEAGRKFEALRRRLITFFDARGCADAEGLTDKTIDRVIRKLPTLTPDFLASFAGETNTLKNPQAAYCYRFAHYVHLEYLEKAAIEGAEMDGNQPASTNPASINMDEQERKELRSRRLDHCLQMLPAEKRQLLVLYFEKEKQAKVDHHKWLAEHFGYSLNALRLQIHRLTRKLYDCISDGESGQ